MYYSTVFFAEGELDEVINPLAVFSFHWHPFEISKMYTNQGLSSSEINRGPVRAFGIFFYDNLNVEEGGEEGDDKRGAAFAGGADSNEEAVILSNPAIPQV